MARPDAEEAGRIGGGGRRAIQKYESGKTPPSDAAVGLVEVLAQHPEALATLRNVRSHLVAVASVATGAKKAAGRRQTATLGPRKPARKLVKARH